MLRKLKRKANVPQSMLRYMFWCNLHANINDIKWHISDMKSRILKLEFFQLESQQWSVKEWSEVSAMFSLQDREDIT